jgi:hypothetical protein
LILGNLKKNHPLYDRTRLVLRKEDVIQARVKRNQLDTLKQNSTVMQKTAERTPTITTREEPAKLAGVSHDRVANGSTAPK